MIAGASQWIGSRQKQEDVYRLRFFPEGGLALVCDGMGGHRDGAMAAAVAAETFTENFAESDIASVTERLLESLDAANDAVAELFAGSSHGGGTTLLAVFVGSGILRWVSVGDSALLLWRHGRLIRLNEDHSMRGLLQRYLPSGEEASRSGAAHMLRSAVMGDDIELVDAPPTPFPLLPGDRLILCSDGADAVLVPGVPRGELAELLDNHDVQNPAAALVELCRRSADAAPADNTTIVVLDALT